MDTTSLCMRWTASESHFDKIGFCYYNNCNLKMLVVMLNISYDPAKNQRNIEERGLSFDQAINFDFDTAWIWQDVRKIYSEVRWSSLGFLNGQLHALVFTETVDGIRIISLRKANPREVRKYEKHSSQS